MSKPASYAAFLLGINIGPHKRVPMSELKKMCERMSFSNVRTLLASGNVVFEAPKKSADALTRELETQLKATFGFEVGVIVRPMTDIQKMLDANPFKKMPQRKMRSDTLLFIPNSRKRRFRQEKYGTRKVTRFVFSLCVRQCRFQCQGFRGFRHAGSHGCPWENARQKNHDPELEHR